jgi:peptide/nickel transport system substrate-binding protein
MRAPLDDKRVRLALNYAFDREGVRGTILSKDAINATQIVMPAIPGHNFELDKKVRAYDPAKAKQLLADAKKDGVPVDKEILLIGRPTGYTGSAEVMEAFMTMYKAIGLNVTLKNVEPGQYNEINNKPFAENRGPTLLQSTHDNNYGDPIFSYPFKYSCVSAQSMMCDKDLDDTVDKIGGLTGDARVKAWQEVFRTLYEDIVPEVWMYHMIGFARVGPKVDFRPTVTTNAELRVEDVKFK